MHTGFFKTFAGAGLIGLWAAGGAAANSLTVSGGLAAYEDEVLTDVIFGPAVAINGRLDNGLYLRAQGMYLEASQDQGEFGADEAEATRGELEAGIAQPAHPWFDVILALEVAHIDRDWAPSRTDSGGSIGFRSQRDGLETEVQALYRHPDRAEESGQVGVRLRTGGIIQESGWGAGVEVTWLTDEAFGSAVVHRRF